MRPAVLLLLLAAVAGAVESQPIDSCDSVSFTPVKDDGKVKVEIVDGKQGKAEQFVFADQNTNAFAQAKDFRGQPAWDQAAGVSFWVKGDGSPHLGNIEFVWNEDYAQRYDVCFRIDSKEWTKVVVPWSDFLPATSNPGMGPLDPKGPHLPSKLGRAWVGKWWFWKDYAACSFALDDIRLEPAIPADGKDHKPKGAPLARVWGKLKAKQPVKVVTMGDSLTDTNHWSNREHNWPAMFVERAKGAGLGEITLDNPAIGGTELRQNVIMIPRWLQTTPKPDLVIIEFGFNDWSNGMRKDAFVAAQVDAIRRVRKATDGHADVLVITTLPAASENHWDDLAELAEACRIAAKQENAGLCDAWKAMHEAGASDKERLYVDDKTHLAKPGQEVLAKAVLDAIEEQGK